MIAFAEAGGWGGLGVEFEFAGEVKALIFVVDEEDGQVAFKNIDKNVGFSVRYEVCLPYQMFCFAKLIRNINVKVVARMVKY